MFEFASLARRLFVVGAAVIGCSLVAGCSQQQPIAKPVNRADPGGMGMSAEQQLQALEANTSMPPRLKARRIAILKQRLGQSSTPPFGPGAGKP